MRLCELLVALAPPKVIPLNVWLLPFRFKVADEPALPRLMAAVGRPLLTPTESVPPLMVTELVLALPPTSENVPALTTVAPV